MRGRIEGARGDGEERARRAAARLLTGDEVRRIAANIAKLPDLLGRRAPVEEQRKLYGAAVRQVTAHDDGRRDDDAAGIRTAVTMSLRLHRTVRLLDAGTDCQLRGSRESTRSHQHVATNPVMPDAARIIATMTNWYIPA